MFLAHVRGDRTKFAIRPTIGVREFRRTAALYGIIHDSAKSKNIHAAFCDKNINKAHYWCILIRLTFMDLGSGITA